MKLLLITTAAVALASAAQAVTFTTMPGAPDPGPAAGERMVMDFDTPNAAGYNWTGGQIAISLVSTAGVAAAPASGPNASLAANLAGNGYGFVSSARNPRFARLSTPDLRSISFYWGSVDAGNSVIVHGANGAALRTITGSELPVQTGNWFAGNSNRRIFITASPGQRITGLTFAASNIALEFDSIAAAAVPEPQQWALLIAGFGLVGAAARRQQRRRMAIA